MVVTQRPRACPKIRVVAAIAAAAALAADSMPGALRPAFAAAPDLYQRPGRMLRLSDGRQMDVRCQGRGRITVLFEGGYMATSAAWAKVQPAVGKFARACAYDRAGLGFSDPGPPPRDGVAIARDLDQALRRAGLQGPFVLVAHSAGALYARLFYEIRPNDVVGMVLVDPSVEFQDARFASRFGPGAGGAGPLRDKAQRCLAAANMGRLPSADPVLVGCTPRPARSGPPRAEMFQAARASTWRTSLSELDNLWTRTSEEVNAARPSYGRMPLVVLTADGTYAAAPPALRLQVDQLWRQLHQELAARSTAGEEQLVTGSSHRVMFDRPDAIVAAVNRVVERSEARLTASAEKASGR